MRLKHRKLICIITSFIMAVTVFGCTSLTFAADGDEDVQAAADNEPAATEQGENSGNEQLPDQSGNGGENLGGGSGNETGDSNQEEPVVLDNPTLNATVDGKKITLTWTLPTPKVEGDTISFELSCDDPSVELIPEEGSSELTVEVAEFKTYTFSIQAKEMNGSDEIASSTASVAVTVTDFANQRLTGLRSDPGYRAVLLEWYPVEGATGYLIFRRRGEERGNADYGQNSDGRNLRTYQQGSSKRCYQKFQTGYSQIKDLPATTAKNASTGKIEYRDGGLQDLNMTYVYFYQYVVVPYYKDAAGNMYYCKGNNGAQTITKTTLKNSVGTDVNVNTVKNNTVLPLYILYRVKKAKPYYRTNSMRDGKKMGRLSKGTYYIGFDKKDGRDRFYMAKGGRTEYWFAQKNANVVQGYYLNNGNSQDLNRKDWLTGYSKKTVLDYVNKGGFSSSSRYLIWVSKYAQHTYIFTGSKGNWKLINNGSDFVTTGSKGSWSNLCASGKVLFNSRNINGPIKGKQYRKKTKKYYYYNISKLHSTVRLHSVLYKKKAAFGSGKYYDKTLGVPKSNGCIRLKPGASQYIYKGIPNGTKTIVF